MVAGENGPDLGGSFDGRGEALAATPRADEDGVRALVSLYVGIDHVSRPFGDTLFETRDGPVAVAATVGHRVCCSLVWDTIGKSQ